MKDGLITLLRWLSLWLCLALMAPAVQAAAYVFPGNLPATCTGAGPSYTCAGLTLLSGDTVTINSPMPATIAVNGALNATGASINSAGNTADLTLNVTGAVTLTASSIKANVNSVGATLNTGSSITGNLAAGSGTITMGASTTVSGNVNCTTTCYLNMSANDITIGGTTTVGYLYNWGNLRARFGGTITARYAYIYLGNDAIVTGDVVLTATHGNGYGVYLGDRSTVSGSLTTAQSGGVYLYGSSQVSGNVSITNTTAGGTNVSSNNIYMYAAAKVLGNVACSNCQLDIQGNNIDIGGTTSVGLIGNPNNYTSYTGAKFGSLLASPSGNTVNASNGQILLGATTTAKGGLYASQAITAGASLNVTGSVTAGGAVNLGASALVTGNVVSSSSVTLSTTTTVNGSITSASSMTAGATLVVQGSVNATGNANFGNSTAVTGSITAGSGVSLGTGSTVGQNLSGGNGTITLTANNSIAGNVSCLTTCYLSMQANDISIGGTTTVGYLYNWGYLRARFGGTITARYAYIYLGNDATVTGDVVLTATHGTNFGVYLGDRSTVSGILTTAQSGGVYLYGSSQVNGNVSITNGTAGGTNVSSNNIYMYTAAKVLGNVACSNCQLDIQGNNIDIGGTTSVGLIGNPNNYTSYTGAKFASLLTSPSGNTVSAVNGQILLGASSLINGGMMASQAITVSNNLTVAGDVTAGGAINLGATASISGGLRSTGSSITTATGTTVQSGVTASTSITMGASANVTGSVAANSGVSLGASSSVGQNLSGGNGTITLTASNSIAGNVSCLTTCYLSMQANDISIGGTTIVGYLYNWGYLRARFGGRITARYAYIYIGNDATVTGDVRLNATYASGYGVYLGDRSTVSGNVTTAQTGGVHLYGGSQVSGNVSITNTTVGGTNVSSNNIYMYPAAKVLGNVACSNCQLDIQGNSIDIGGTTSVGLIGNPNNYTSYTGAKFGSLLASPSGNTVNASNGQILLGASTTAKGGLYASQAITAGASLNVTGSVTAGGAVNLGASALITGNVVSSSSVTLSSTTTVNGSITAASSMTAGATLVVQGSITAGSGVSLGTTSTVGQNLSGGSGTVTLTANNTIAGNVSCLTTCYLSMQANDIFIGGTTTVGYLYNWGNLRARFGGTITARYAYIYLGNDATVTGDVVLTATHGTSFGVYLGARTIVSGNVSSAQTGGIVHYANSTSQCTRTLSSGTITLNAGSRPQGVCCASAGFGSSCSSSCVSNSSGLSMPVGCQPPNGLNGSYYNTTDLTGAVALSRRDGPVDFNWGAGGPGPGVNADNFSVRWTGAVLVPSSGWYTFQTGSDDGVRLWVNGQQLVNSWYPRGLAYDTPAPVYLKAGTRYPIEMHFYELTGAAAARLLWKRPLDAAFTAIPYGDGTQGLYPDTVPVVPDAGAMSGAVWWGRAGSFSGADNTGMSAWANDADSSRNLTGSTTRPAYRNTNALNINFNPVVEFTSGTSGAATAQHFSAPSFLGGLSHAQTHLFFVGYPTQQVNTYFFWEGAPSMRVSAHLPWSDGTIYWDSGPGRVQYVESSLLNVPRVFSFVKNANSTANLPLDVNQGFRRNGVTRSTRSPSGSVTGNNTNFYLGWNPTEGTAPWRGVVAEGLFVLDKAMTAAELNQIESYLSVKYGSTLGENAATGSGYQDSAAATLWPAATGFHNNIAGIGRDDKMLLDQRISRSVNSGSQVTATSKATMPDGTSTVSAQEGVQFADKSFVIWGDNGLASTSTVNIAAGSLAGRTRSMRLWRLQTSGTLPAQWTVCIPDAMLPSSFLSGNLADLQFNASSSSDLSVSPVSVSMSAGNCPGSGVGVTASVPGRVATLSSAQLSALGSVSYFSVTRRLLDHLEITASSSSGVTCSPTTYTIKACADAACTSLYTGGVSGTLTLAGSGLTVNFPAGAGFSIPSGSSQTTITAQVTTPGTATVGATGLSITPGNSQSVFCGLGATAAAANSCAMAVADTGFLFDVPHHRSGATQTITLSAVKKADNSLACAPAFTGSKSVNFKCQYQNPGSGTLPVLVGAAGLNAAAAATTACDASGANRTLNFDSNGQASTTVQYLDVGQMKLIANWTGSSGSDIGLSLSGEDSFIVAPHTFAVQPAATAQVAGVGFGVTVTAVNAANNRVPNFGLETVPERPALVLYRAKPGGAAAQDGVFSTGTAGALSAGAITFSGVSWSEVGRADVAAKLSSGSYLGSGYSAFYSTGAWTFCANQGVTCTLPAGVTATVSFDAGAAGFTYRHGVSGSLACSAASFPIDPAAAVAKACWYAVETGSHTSSAGALTFSPHHFDVTTAAACGSFSYAGQPFTTTVTARNAQGQTTRNYDGSVGTSPNFAKTANLTLASANTSGSLSGSVAASSFLAGVGTDMSTFSFTNKLTAEQTISVRATDTDGVSSSSFAEGSMVLRSGRLQMSNAFGGDKTSLQIPLQLQYWSGKSWVLNSADTCTVIPPASVVRARTLNHNNTAATWSSAVSSVSLSGGSGFITLAAPSPSGTGTVDLALNLGLGSSDNSCNSVNGSATGAGVPWLRSRQGSCASSFDRDPSARGTFGIYAPETRRSVHVREVF
ncbi:MAG: DUF6701 domain-containing protein [Ideonella sp.]|nr:DUF6701 domain-containing protein [Ideonella sp.]